MSEGDRSAEPGSRVIPMRTRSGPRRVAPLLSPGDVARRLAALERQVEEALGGDRVSRSAVALERAIEDALGAYATGRAWLAGQTAGLTSSLVGELSLMAL